MSDEPQHEVTGLSKCFTAMLLMIRKSAVQIYISRQVFRHVSIIVAISDTGRDVYECYAQGSAHSQWHVLCLRAQILG